MTETLFAALQDESKSVQALYRSWRTRYREDTDSGTLMILQLVIDLTGFNCTLTLEDVENIDNLRELTSTRILKSPYHDPDVFGKPIVVKRIFKYLELLIVHDSAELLLNNIWLNYFIKILVSLCESNVDECQMVAGYLSMLVMKNLSDVCLQLIKRQEMQQSPECDSPVDAKKHQRYISKVFKMMLRNVEISCGYAATLPIIAELYCSMLQKYPRIYIVENCMLELLNTFLQHRHGKMFQIVATCIRDLLNPELHEQCVVDNVSKFFIETAGMRFTQAMFNYKSSEKIAMEVVISVQRLNCGKSILDENAVEKIRQQMFNSDEMIRGYAIDFHICTLCNRNDSNNIHNLTILQHILQLYVQYDHSADALNRLVADLWNFQFFDDWSMLFKVLKEEAARSENHFMVISVVQIINQCYALLLNDLEKKIGDRYRLNDILKDFLNSYPSGLQMCAGYEYAYISLLQSADATHHDKIKTYDVNVNRFYDELFVVLDEVARTGNNFFTLCKTISVIQGYWDIIADVEQILAEIRQTYYNDFFEIREKINSQNMGQITELMDQYALSLNRLTAMIEITTNVDSGFQQLFCILLNDCRLLDQMRLSNVQTSIFHRLYKCLFYVLIGSLQAESDEQCLTEMLGTLRQTGLRLKKRLLELLRVLIKQLQKYDETLDTSVHTFISVCDMLLVTQTDLAHIDIIELQTLSYTVEPALLEKMAKFLLNYVFSKNYDWRDAPIMKQKQMLAKYVQFYEMHNSLPRISDTHFVLTNFAVDSVFDECLRNLMKVLHHIDLAQFCGVICQTVYQLLEVYKSESCVKNFLKKFQKFALVDLANNDKESYQKIIGNVIEKLLDHLMQTMSDPEPVAELKRMLKLIEPLLLDVSTEQRLTLQNFLRNHTEYERLVDGDRKVINRFIKHLRPLNG